MTSVTIREPFVAAIERRLKEPLPGLKAHRRFSPEMSYGRHACPPLVGVRSSAVILALYRSEGEWRIPLTLRPNNLQAHPGQISLPGGSLEYGESTAAAAQRELNEELGVSASVMIGRLSEIYLFTSNYRITPWIGLLSEPPQWQANPSEVDEVLEMPIASLLDTRATETITMDRGGMFLSAPAFCWNNHRIWGATSMILSEFADVVSDCLDTD